jgi:hypothetical protein
MLGLQISHRNSCAHACVACNLPLTVHSLSCRELNVRCNVVILFQRRGPEAVVARTTCRLSCSTRCTGTTFASRGTGQWPDEQRAFVKASHLAADPSGWRRRWAQRSLSNSVSITDASLALVVICCKNPVWRIKVPSCGVIPPHSSPQTVQ